MRIRKENEGYMLIITYHEKENTDWETSIQVRIDDEEYKWMFRDVADT